MTEPVMTTKEDLAQLSRAAAQAVEAKDRAEREVKALRTERDQLRDSLNRSRIEVGRLQKHAPSDKLQEENKGLRGALSDAHKRVSALEKELTEAKAEAEAQRKAAAKVARQFEGVQSTFDTLQIARDKAQAARDLAISDQQKAVDAFQKLQAEFDAYKKAAEAKAPAKPAKAPQPQEAAKA